MNFNSPTIHRYSQDFTGRIDLDNPWHMTDLEYSMWGRDLGLPRSPSVSLGLRHHLRSASVQFAYRTIVAVSICMWKAWPKSGKDSRRYYRKRNKIKQKTKKKDCSVVEYETLSRRYPPEALEFCSSEAQWKVPQSDIRDAPSSKWINWEQCVGLA